ncbi:MAG: DJ-1/PfpI family protein [Spirochaetes bacterium]|jgi:4-methyl-5(b-hydroxyethyl)-thiazole monophosphate biosynthesis|nr:DJ-1/PfpI family protein [Spirochaetota bacterium]
MNKKVLLFLPQGFEAYEAAVFTDVMGWSRIKGGIPVDLITTGFHTEIKCTWNFRVRPEIPYDEIDAADYDALALPGGFSRAGFYADAFDERLLKLIRQFNREKKIIAAVCVAALPLGKSGILKNRNATTYDLMDNYRQKQLSEFGAYVVDDHLVVDENIITSTGPKTAIDVAFKLLELLTDVNNVKTVKGLMRFT